MSYRLILSFGFRPITEFYSFCLEEYYNEDESEEPEGQPDGDEDPGDSSIEE